MPDLPSGTVTFLFTDIEGSTTLWKRDRKAMAVVPRPLQRDEGIAVTPEDSVERSCRRIPDRTNLPVPHRIACAMCASG